MMRSKWIYALLIAAMASGCTKNGPDAKPEEPSWSNKVFTATIEQQNSRTHMENGKYLRWNAGDQISLFRGSTLNRQYQFDGETGDNSGTFSIVDSPFGTGYEFDKHYAVYPYHASIKISEEGVVSMSLPAEQKYAENSFGLGANTMVAVTKDLEDTFLGFRNTGGYLKLQLYGENITLKSLLLKGNADEKIAGKASITPLYGQLPTISMTADATGTILLDCGEEGVTIGSSSDKVTDFWFVVPPVTFESGFMITITDTDGNTIDLSTSKQFVVERNVIKPMVAVNLKEFSNTHSGIGVLKEETPMTDDDTEYTIDGGEMTENNKN